MYIGIFVGCVIIFNVYVVDEDFLLILYIYILLYGGYFLFK